MLPTSRTRSLRALSLVELVVVIIGCGVAAGLALGIYSFVNRPAEVSISQMGEIIQSGQVASATVNASRSRVTAELSDDTTVFTALPAVFDLGPWSSMLGEDGVTLEIKEQPSSFPLWPIVVLGLVSVWLLFSGSKDGRRKP
jgi:hypothetical protein